MALPSVHLWDWFDKLIARQQADLRETVVDCMRRLDAPMIEAFVAYRHDTLAYLREEQVSGNG